MQDTWNDQHLDDTKTPTPSQWDNSAFLRPVSAPPQLQHPPPPVINSFLYAAAAAATAPFPGNSSPYSTQSSTSSALATPNEAPPKSTYTNEAFRYTPEYHQYYYSQRPLDPRLPPPLFEAGWGNSFYPKEPTITNRSFAPPGAEEDQQLQSHLRASGTKV